MDFFCLSYVYNIYYHIFHIYIIYAYGKWCHNSPTWPESEKKNIWPSHWSSLSRTLHRNCRHGEAKERWQGDTPTQTWPWGIRGWKMIVSSWGGIWSFKGLCLCHSIANLCDALMPGETWLVPYHLVALYGSGQIPWALSKLMLKLIFRFQRWDVY